MKVSLPTSLLGYTYYNAVYAQPTGLQLVAALARENEDVEIPSILKCTRGHGNKVTHAKPLYQTTAATSIRGSRIRNDLEVHINDGYQYWYNVSEDTPIPTGRETHRGAWVRDYKRVTYEGAFVEVNNKFSWVWAYSREFKKNMFHCTITKQTKESIPLLELPNSRVRLTVSTYKFQDDWWSEVVTPADPGGEYAGDVVSTTKDVTGYPIYIDWPDFDLLIKGAFRFGEYAVLWYGYKWSDEVRHAMTLAFQDAFSNVPQYADNNISNIVQMSEMVIDAFKPETWPGLLDKAAKLKGVFRSSREAAKAVSNLWLAYRYAYSTTKSDTLQAIDAASRRMVTYMDPLRFNGSSVLNSVVDGISATCRVGFDIVLNGANMLGMLRHYDRMVGMDLTAYKLWDLVPFSFIVDWFFDVGGALEDQDILDSYSDYIFSNFWWSISYDTDFVKPVVTHVYSRWSENYVPETIVREYNAAGHKTWLKRVGDTVALTIGALS